MLAAHDINWAVMIFLFFFLFVIHAFLFVHIVDANPLIVSIDSFDKKML